MVQKLIDAPGTKANYCDFGYDVLRLVIAETIGHPCSDYIRNELFRPFGMAEIKEMQAPGVQVQGEPPQVWNALSVDFDTYPVQPCSPVRASAPALCTFMKYFWIGGEPRNRTNWYFTFDGSTDNTLSHICQRAGEKFADADFAFIFNGRTEGVGTGEIEAELKQIIK